MLMRVLIACEFSGVVRRAFRSRGHDAWSCDLLPAEDDEKWHIQGDALDAIDNPPMGEPWDLLIAHPPCTRLANSGVRWLYKGGRGTVRDPQKWREMEAAAEFYNSFLDNDIERVAIENPIMHEHSAALVSKPYDQLIQPWQFGHREMKATCLCLRGLPPLADTDNVGPPPKDREQRKSWARVHRESPGPDRWKNRSRTLQGIADAMAEQWGNYGD